jgi:hypothetical protein
MSAPADQQEAEPISAPATTTAPAEAAPVEDSPAEPTTTPGPSPIAQLWELAKASGHPEIWGVTLADPESHIPTQIVLQKYLNANDGDLAKATDQLTKTLEWRAKTHPLELAKNVYSKAKFEGLGYVTKYLGQDGAQEPEQKEVFTWNIYGGAKSIDETFSNLEE